MNLLLRLMWLFLRTRNDRLQASSERLTLSFFITLFDCDLNGHMTNSRYLALMDLGRLHLVKAAGLLGLILKGQWYPLIHSLEITYIKEILPFQTIQLTTQIIAYDHKYIYVEQCFIADNQLYAVARSRGLFRSKEGNIPTSELFKLLDQSSHATIAYPKSIQLWNDYLKEKKNETT